MTAFRSGYVAFIGRPNAGKSTLLNRILESKIAITSHKPQTTRDRIAGVHTTDTFQLVLVDTPGIHDGFSELNKAMVRKATGAIADVDAVCWLEDLEYVFKRLKAGKPALDKGAEAIAEMIRASGTPVVFAPNKIDSVGAETALPAIAAFQEQLELHTAVPISAQKGTNVDALVDVLAKLMPEGPHLFPEDHLTDVTERFIAAELIREQLLRHTRQEVPYAAFVEIDVFDESERDDRGLTRIHATVIVERDSQKGIVVGKGGTMIKRIGIDSRKELQRMLDCQVHLELFVKVVPEWTKTAKGLRRVGFSVD